MRKSRVYLDTSVISFLFAEDAPEKREATVTFFEDFVRPGVYDVYVSPVVIDEISRTRDRTKRKVLLDVVDEYGIEVLDIGERLEDIRGLAQAYVAESIVPVRQPEDALHIAIATVEEIDVLLSWNYKHIRRRLPAVQPPTRTSIKNSWCRL